MNGLIRSIPTVVLVPTVILITGLLAYLLARAIGEGREVSFWPPRIGPRPQATAEQPAHAPTQNGNVKNDVAESFVPTATGLPHVFVPAEPIAVLHVIGGTGHGNCYIVTSAFRSVTVGRSKDCNLALADVVITRHQFRINIEPAASETPGNRRYEFTLIDSGSVNGTFVNGFKVHEIRLSNGDLIEIGGVSLRFFKLARMMSGAVKQAGA